MSFPNLNALWAHALVDALAANGVGRVVISPGSRSTPLALAAHAHPGLQCHVLVDERSAAFFALGLARGGQSPVALVCTSGTAGANYHPALVEAALTGVPLVVVTADRPPRLRQLGAAQTIDQTHLFGRAAKRFSELPMPEPSAVTLRQMATQVALAVATAKAAPRGPVHLNAPFDEPLAPVPRDPEGVAALATAYPGAPRVAAASLQADAAALGEVASALAAARRPLVLAGPGAGDGTAGEALLRWAAGCGVPVVADIGANLRGCESEAQVLTYADAWMRHPAFAAPGPDLLIRVGGAPTAKGVLTWLSAARPQTIMLQADTEGREPEAAAAWIVPGDLTSTFEALSALTPPLSIGPWCAALAAYESTCAQLFCGAASPVPAEARALAAAAAALPPGGRLALSNSLPIRHADTYLGRGPQGVTTTVFRGANGIDGVSSASLGLAVATGAPMLLVTGDLAFLHDMGGLLASRELSSPMVILVINNDGGGIFSYLPVAEATPHFEPLFGTPHGLDFASAARFYGLAHVSAASPGEVHGAVAAGLARPGLTIVEFTSVREETASDHKACMARVTEALAEAAACPV